jgi:hypothetical protein
LKEFYYWQVCNYFLIPWCLAPGPNQISSDSCFQVIAVEQVAPLVFETQ